MTKHMMRLAMVALAIGLASTIVVEAGDRHHRRDRLVTATYGLEESARDAARHLMRGPHRVSYRNQRALRRLVELQRETRQLRRDLWRFGPRSARVRHDLRDLHRAFNRARYALDARRPNRWIRADLVRITRAMRRLDHAFEMRMAYRGHPRRGYRIDDRWPAVYDRPEPYRGRAHAGRWWDDEYRDD